MPCGTKSTFTPTFPILEGVSRRQLEQAFAPLLEYLDADGLADVKSLEPDEPGLKFDEKELLLTVCWTGEIGRSFHGALEAALDNLGPFCYEAVEVDLTLYHENGEQESKLLFVGPTAQAIHEAQRRCMVEDVAAILGRQFDKDDVAQVDRAGQRPVRPRLEGKGFAGEEARARVRDLHPAFAGKTCTEWQAPKYPGFDTLALHAGQSPDPATGSRAVPIYQTTSYVFRDTEHAASLFNMERAGHVYSRISNPTVAVLEERIAALEGGVGAIATASGQAALHLAVATLMGAGGHIVASGSLYGGSHNLLGYTLKRFGIETTFVNPRDLHAWKNSDPAEHPAAVRRNAGQPGPRRARHPGGRGDRARGEGAAAGRRDVHHAVPDASRSSSAPTCCTTRRPSSSAATASRSAACWSTPGASTGRPRASSRR